MVRVALVDVACKSVPGLPASNLAFFFVPDTTVEACETTGLAALDTAPVIFWALFIPFTMLNMMGKEEDVGSRHGIVLRCAVQTVITGTVTDGTTSTTAASQDAPCHLSVVRLTSAL